MTDLDRLLDGSPSPRTRALLRAGQAETPPERFSRQLLVSVSAAATVGAVATTATASLATSAKLGGLVSGAAVGSAAAPGLALVAAKWVAVGVLGGGILAASADLALSPGREKASAAKAVNVSVARRAEPPVAVAAPREGTAAKPLEPTESTESSAAPAGNAATTASGTAPVAVPAGAPSGQLGREVELIDRVRRALAAGNTSRALSELDAFARVANTGVLDREARVLRIQALREAGDATGARKLADQYLLDFPNDAHAIRLRAQDANHKP